MTRLRRGQERLETQRPQAGAPQENQGTNRKIDESSRC